MSEDVLEKALADINKKFGKGTIFTLGEQEPVSENLLTTGSLLIDKALGGGIAYGRITEIYGVESSGKSTLCLHLAKECQAAGGKVAYIDTENALDVKYARKLGVDIDAMIMSQPNCGEQALEIVDTLAQTGKVNLIIVDSVAALVPQAEIDGEMGDVTIGLQARLMSKFCRKVTHTINETNCAVVCINQIRDKVSTGWSSGPTETTTGGRALKFYSSQRIELRKGKAISKGESTIGNMVRVKVVKNKIAPPMKVVELPMIFGEGFSSDNELVDLAIEYGLIEKAGSWLTTHDGQRLQGKESAVAYYKTHLVASEDLREKVRQHLTGVEIKEEYEVDEKTGEIIE